MGCVCSQKENIDKEETDLNKFDYSIPANAHNFLNSTENLPTGKSLKYDSSSEDIMKLSNNLSSFNK